MLTTLKVVYYCVHGHTKIINMIFDIVQQFSSWCNSSLLPVRPPPYNAIAYHMHHSAHCWHYPIWESVECLLEILRFPPLLKTAATSHHRCRHQHMPPAVQCTVYTLRMRALTPAVHCTVVQWSGVHCSVTTELSLRQDIHTLTSLETVSKAANTTKLKSGGYYWERR